MAFAEEGFELVVPVEAGPRVIGATFPREMWEEEGVLQPRLFGYHLAVMECDPPVRVLREYLFSGRFETARVGTQGVQVRYCLPDVADDLQQLVFTHLPQV